MNGGENVGVSELRSSADRTRGTLRVYLGAAPGVGKTFAMLNEGRRRVERGTDVVVGFVETHGRVHTAEQLGWPAVMPRRRFEHRDATFEEMDVDAILARRPELVLVDELAHTNAPGSRNAKRYQDVDELLDAGIDVITTVNIQHLESLNDVVEGITGIRQRETVPDRVVRAADQIELVDMSPEALRRRLAHGNVYAADKVDAALGNYFRAGNLSALRELALLWVADRVDDALADYRERHGITATWETRERVVVALSGAPGGARLVRRAARDRPARQGRPDRRARDRRQRALRRLEHRRRDGDRRATAPARGVRRHLPPRHRQRRRRGAARGRPLGERHPDRARRQRPLVVAPAGQRLGRSTGSCGGRGRSTCT